MNDFVTSGPKNGRTQNVFGFRINRDFDETLSLIPQGESSTAVAFLRDEVEPRRCLSSYL